MNFLVITEVFRIFSAAGENFSKNDQNQWFLYQNRIFMDLFDIFLSHFFHNHEKARIIISYFKSKNFNQVWTLNAFCERYRILSYLSQRYRIFHKDTVSFTKDIISFKKIPYLSKRYHIFQIDTVYCITFIKMWQMWFYTK